MTVPVFIEEPITWKQIKVPYDIVQYCDSFTLDANREDLRYLDCVLMHMGYYGTSVEIMEKYRRDLGFSILPVFE